MECIVRSLDEKTFTSISVPLQQCAIDLCDRRVGCPDGKHILVRCHYYDVLSRCAVVWYIGGGEEFQIEGFDFVFIHYGRNKGRIASMDWIDEDRSSIWIIASTDLEDKNGPLTQPIASTDLEDRGPRSTRVLVKLWDIGSRIFDRLSKVTDVVVAQFSPNGQYLAVGRRSENVVELLNLESLIDSLISLGFFRRSTSHRPVIV